MYLMYVCSTKLKQNKKEPNPMVIRVLVQPTSCIWLLLDFLQQIKKIYILPSGAPLATTSVVVSSFFSASGSSLITLAFGSLTEDLEVEELNVVSSTGC